MTLETHSVDSDPIRLDEFDDVACGVHFGAVIFEVVVIVVELRIWIRFCRKTECNWNEGFADDIVKNAVSVCSVFVQGCKGSMSAASTYIYIYIHTHWM